MKTKARAIAGSVLFFAVAPAVVAGWIPHALTGWQMQPVTGGVAVRVLGAAAAAVGLLVLLDCFRRFAVEGFGTPAPVAPTEQLVVSGWYRHVRNPMYLALTALIGGQALLFGSRRLLAYAASVWLAVHLFVLLYEEPALQARFGDAYREYRLHVRRWWPRLAPWTRAPRD